MKQLILLCSFLSHVAGQAQQNYIWDTEHISSLRLVVDDDPLLPPVIKLDDQQQIELSFDAMGHNYRRLVYHVEHCSQDWQTEDAESLFESDYLIGMNGKVIEDADISFNTNQLYTHYRLTLPNENLRLRLSGNYRISVYDEDDYPARNKALLKAEFCIVENGMSIQAQVGSNTDIDFNKEHQQISYTIQYGSLPVIDPQRELYTIVKQNQRNDNAVINLQPNVRKANGVEFTHRKELIFPAGAEFRKFEVIDMHRPNLNVDNLRWQSPYHHATLYTDQPLKSYLYDEDANGGSILRNAEYADEHLTSEYLWVHFSLQTGQRLPGGDVYICGLWTNGTGEPNYRMEWDEENGAYRAALYLKQGYYNYQYRQYHPQTRVGLTRWTEGDFYETKNEYTILVYYRPQGGRYDRLVGYTRLNSN